MIGTIGTSRVRASTIRATVTLRFTGSPITCLVRQQFCLVKASPFKDKASARVGNVPRTVPDSITRSRDRDSRVRKTSVFRYEWWAPRFLSERRTSSRAVCGPSSPGMEMSRMGHVWIQPKRRIHWLPPSRTAATTSKSGARSVDALASTHAWSSATRTLGRRSPSFAPRCTRIALGN